MEIISNNSHRKDNKIIYNFDEIEGILGTIILPKIKCFKEDIRKVIYQYECFVGDRSSIIVNFTEKYQQRKLTDEELKNVINYIIENQKNKKFNIKNFLFSFQVLIDVILDQSPHLNDTLLSVAKLTNSEIIINFFTAMTENENIISINNKNKNINLMEIISDNSYRKDNKVIYNYDEIERILASSILPKIKGFKDDIRKVIYQYECFVGDRSNIIVNFTEKYQQRKLTDEEYKNVINFILVNKKNKKFNIKNFLFSFQVLIDVILDENPSINDTLLSVTSKNINLFNFDIINNFFMEMNEKEKNNNLTISTLIDIFDIVELFCWDIIREIVDKEYLQDINEDIKIQIDTYFDVNPEQKNNNNMIISKIDLCSAIRKFISRYLSGKSDENINPKNQLKNYLIFYIKNIF
jgi:hypothetical protein